MQEGNISAWPLLDEETVEELRVLMEEDFADLLETYLDELPTHLASIHQGVSTGQVEMVWRTAHTLKASSGSIGATRISELCRQIEMAGREGAVGLLAPLLDQLRVVAGETEAAMQAKLA